MCDTRHHPSRDLIKIGNLIEGLLFTLFRALPVAHMKHRQLAFTSSDGRRHATIHPAAGKDNRQHLKLPGSPLPRYIYAFATADARARRTVITIPLILAT